MPSYSKKLGDMRPNTGIEKSTDIVPTTKDISSPEEHSAFLCVAELSNNCQIKSWLR